MVICPACNKAVRVKSGEEGGKRVRVCPKCGAVLDKAYAGRRARKSRRKSPKSVPESARQRPKQLKRRRKTRLNEKVNDYGNRATTKKVYNSRVAEQYAEEGVVPYLTKKFGYTNVMQVPQAGQDSNQHRPRRHKGQRKVHPDHRKRNQADNRPAAILTKAKKSVANFKVREGMTVGIKVTLRGKMMYDFYDKLVSSRFPACATFRGVPTDSFDGRGNYCMGVKEQLIFPEIQYDQVEKIRGMDICFVNYRKDR